jgi:hypothetical protein
MNNNLRLPIVVNGSHIKLEHTGRTKMFILSTP